MLAVRAILVWLLTLLGVQNVSSPFAVKGSDVDLQWQNDLATSIVKLLGWKEVRPGVYRAESIWLNTEIFVCRLDTIDAINEAVLSNLRTMRNWSAEIKAAYMAAKQAIEDLIGKARKLAKAKLAELFNLIDVWTLTMHLCH
jgi:hypothetical protein